MPRATSAALRSGERRRARRGPSRPKERARFDKASAIVPPMSERQQRRRRSVFWPRYTACWVALTHANAAACNATSGGVRSWLHCVERFRRRLLRLRRSGSAEARRQALQRRLAVLQPRALTRPQRACAKQTQTSTCQHRLTATKAHAALPVVCLVSRGCCCVPARCSRLNMAARPRSCVSSVSEAHTAACSPRPQRSTSSPVRALKYLTAARLRR